MSTSYQDSVIQMEADQLHDEIDQAQAQLHDRIDAVMAEAARSLKTEVDREFSTLKTKIDNLGGNLQATNHGGWSKSLPVSSSRSNRRPQPPRR